MKLSSMVVTVISIVQLGFSATPSGSWCVSGGSIDSGATAITPAFNACQIIPAGPFTAEMWVYPDSTYYFTQFMVYQPGADTRGLIVSKVDTFSFVPNRRTSLCGYLAFHQDINPVTVAEGDTLPRNQWSHIAAVSTGTVAKIFINGIVKVTVTDNNPTYCGSNAEIYFINSGCKVDNIRFSTVARYSTNFIPDTTFSADANTAVLLMFDSKSHGDTLIDAVNNLRFNPSNSPRLTWLPKLPIYPVASPDLIAIPSPTINRKPVFKWHPFDSATGYTIQIDTNRSFTTPMATVPLTDTTYATVTDLPIDTIFWRVKASNTSYSDYSFFIVQDGRIPILIPYQPKITNITKPTLKWYTTAGATSYTFIIASTSNFSTPLATVPLTDTSYTLPTNLPVGNIYWKVKSSLVDTYCDPDQFLIVSDTIPFLVRFNGAVITTQKPAFKWSTVTGATSYQIQIANNASFTNASSIPLTDTFYIPSVNLVGGIQYWRVSCSKNLTLYSIADSLIINTSSAVSNFLKAQSNKLTVNYQNNAFVFNIPTTYTGRTDMVVYNIAGRICAKSSFVGNGAIRIPVSRLSKNIYAVVLKNRAGMFNSKIFVQ